MKIGISIPFDYFAVVPQSKTALILHQKIGNYRCFLEKLHDSEVNFIELRGVIYNTPDYIIKNICQELWEKGFSLSIHTDLPEKVIDEDSNLNFTFLKKIIGQINNFQEKLILVIHSYSKKSCNYYDLLEKSARNISLIAKIIETEKLPINFAIELTRGAIETTPGTTYDSLLQLNDKINSEKIGFCWDFGHAYSNMLKNTIPLTPPQAFTSKVVHTHIHGVDKNDTTHCPLNETNLPLGDYMEPLIKNHYNGIYNLEINPEQLPEANALDIYVENVNRIKEILK